MRTAATGRAGEPATKQANSTAAGASTGVPATHSFQHRADVAAALADPRLVPIPVGSGPLGGMAWFRAEVARFASGEVHARRRRLIEADIERLDPALLRALASAGRPDVGDRHRVVRALAEALDLADPPLVAAHVATIADVYFGGDDPGADAAVAWLLAQMGDVDPETAANRIGILVQACDATATLIANARKAPGTTVEARIAHALRYDPPVRVMRRVAASATRVAGTDIAAGDLVLLDVATASLEARPGRLSGPAAVPGRSAHGTADGHTPAGASPPPRDHPLTFGAPPRVCPGMDQALAIAAGALTDDPAAPIRHLVDHTLALAATWTAWDGRPFPVGDRVYTPHKAVRRTADHLLDHLAELEARLAGQTPAPDLWHASASTTPADLAPFTVEDLDEARSRLTRLAGLWEQRLHALSAAQLDDSPGEGWSFRDLALHLAGSVYYADSVGDLTVNRGSQPEPSVPTAEPR